MKHSLVLFFIGVSCFLFACGKEMSPPLERVEAASQGEKIQSLIEALGDESEQVRGAAAEALGDGSESVRIFAARALGQIGEPAKEVVPALIEALGDESKSVRRSAAWALGQIGTPEAMSAIEK